MFKAVGQAPVFGFNRGKTQPEPGKGILRKHLI